MKIVPHAGNCCGIKTIADIDASPDEVVKKKSESSQDILSCDRTGDDFYTEENFYWMERPKETAGERFQAYLEYLAKVRRYGLVEVSIIVPCITCEQVFNDAASVLEQGLVDSYEELIESVNEADSNGNAAEFGCYEIYDNDISEGGTETGGYGRQDSWIPFLEERGFNKVSEFPNINSGNLVQVYHLIMDSTYHKNLSKKEK